MNTNYFSRTTSGSHLRSSAALPLNSSITSDVEKVENSMSTLIQDIYAKTSSSKSFIMSPIGLMSTIDVLMKFLGKNKDEIAFKTLDLTQERYHIAILEIFKKLNCRYGNDLEIINQRHLFLEKGISINNEFQQLVEELCEEGLEYLATDSDNEEIVQRMNAKINEITHGLIPKLLSPSDLRDVNLAFFDTLYFDALWETEWNVSPDDFHVGGNNICCEFMNVQTTVDFTRTSSFQCVWIKYKQAGGQQATFCLIVPFREENFSEILKLTQDDIRTLRKKASSVKVRIMMPMLDLKTRMENIADYLPFRPSISLKIIQESRIKVGPKRTTAASATSTTVLRSNPIPQITANHPFKFVLQVEDRVLFDGVVSDSEALVPVQNKREYFEKALKNFPYNIFDMQPEGWFSKYLLKCAKLDLSQLSRSLEDEKITIDEAFKKMQEIFQKVSKSEIGVIDPDKKLFQNLIAFTALNQESDELSRLLKDITANKKESEISKLVLIVSEYCKKIYPLHENRRVNDDEMAKALNLSVCCKLETINFFRQVVKKYMDALSVPTSDGQVDVRKSYEELGNNAEKLLQRVSEKKHQLLYLYLASAALESVFYMNSKVYLNPTRIKHYLEKIEAINCNLDKVEKKFDELKQKVKKYTEQLKKVKELCSKYYGMANVNAKIAYYENIVEKSTTFIKGEKLEERELYSNLREINNLIDIFEKPGQNLPEFSFSDNGEQAICRMIVDSKMDLSKIQI